MFLNFLCTFIDLDRFRRSFEVLVIRPIRDERLVRRRAHMSLLDAGNEARIELTP